MDENKKSECAEGRATTPASMTLGEAEAIIAGALERAAEMDLGPLTVAVLDPAGKLVALKRQDRSSLLRPDIAQAKAYGALAMGMGSRGLAVRAQGHPAFVASITALAGGMLVPVPGGVLCYDGLSVVGAVGVSGALPDEDEECALAGIGRTRLEGETGSRH